MKKRGQKYRNISSSNISEEHRQTNTKRYELTRSKDYAFKLLCSKQFSSYRIRWLEDNFQTLERLRRGKSQVDSRPNLICECQHVYLIMSFSKWQYYWECIMKSIHLSYCWGQELSALFLNQYFKHLSQIKISFMIYTLTEKRFLKWA